MYNLITRKHVPFVLLMTVLLVLIAAFGLYYQHAQSDRPRMVYSTAQLAGQAFVAQYESAHGSIDPATETWLIHEATSACERLNADLTLPQVFDLGVRDGMSSDQAATVIDVAMNVYCPESRPQS